MSEETVALRLCDTISLNLCDLFLCYLNIRLMTSFEKLRITQIEVLLIKQITNCRHAATFEDIAVCILGS